MKSIVKIRKFLLPFFNELLIIFLYIFLVNNYIGNTDETIKADGKGYYDYLPSVFIHHDLVRKNIPLEENTGIYDRILDYGVYVDYKEFKVNKYPCGTAILEFPFFLYTFLTTDLDGTKLDGYQLPFQRTIFYAAIFYLFLSLYFLKRILQLYDIKPWVISFSQLLLTLATPVTNYAKYDAGFSHVYSLFAITAFLYFVKLFFNDRKGKDVIIASILLGLILTLRQINVLIVLIIPFLAGSAKNLRDGFQYLLKKPGILFPGIAIIAVVFFIQSLMWYLQTGEFLLKSYQGESFNFTDPQFFRVLFSYKKGLFLYTPVLFIALLSSIWVAYRKKYYLTLTWLGFFILLTYVTSSWWNWYYGHSYSLRAYIDYFAVFFILMAIAINEMPRGLKILIIALSSLTIPLNLIQTYQYKEYILHYISMDKEKYWKVFLQTDKKYKGILWKQQYNPDHFQILRTDSIGDYNIIPEKEEVFYSMISTEVDNFLEVSVIQVLIDNDFKRENDTELILRIEETETSEVFYWHKRYLLHFAENEFDKLQTGIYNFEFQPAGDNLQRQITFKCRTDKIGTELKNVRIRFLKHL